MSSRTERVIHAVLIAAALGGATFGVVSADARTASVSVASGAKGKARAKVLVSDANEAYKAERFTDALVAYTEAYGAFPAPGLLFNIAQCHRLLKHHALALEAYERFLREGSPSDADRAAVNELVAGVRRAQGEERRSMVRAPAPRITARTRPVPAVVTRSPPLAASAPPVYKRWWFWTAVGTAAVVATGAIVLSTSGNDVPQGSLGTLDYR